MTRLFMSTTIEKGIYPTLDFVFKFTHSPNYVTVILVVVVEVTIGEVDVPCVSLVVLRTTPAVRG